MKITILFFSIFLFSTSSMAQNIDFETFFEDKSLRMDYLIAGSSEASTVFFKQFKEEPFWGGSTKNMIDKFNLGDYRILMRDSASGKLLYTRGFSSLFYEWQDTEQAKITERSFYESVVMPFPKQTVHLKIQVRDNENKFVDLYQTYANPTNYFVVKDKCDKYKVLKIHNSGNHHKKLDVVILPEGYTKAEMGKFKDDCERFVDYFFEVEPFKSNKNKVNFWAVNAPSEESGTDIPGSGVWKNTILNSNFYTFGIERYLTTSDINSVRNLAAYAPYDQIYILVNTSKYGGGGIFNYYNLCGSNIRSAREVFTHEFGHAFAALADEYAYGSTKAEDLYNLEVEPWMVNISTLADFDLKWKDLVENDTPIPTPNSSAYKNKVGAFEGGGYVAKKIYRPSDNCKMKSNSTNNFCPVCYRAVYELLLFYSE